MSKEPGLQLNISVPDIEQVQAQMLTMKNKAPLVIQRAINNTIKQVSKDVGNEAKKVYVISQTEVKKTLSTKKATKRDLTGIVSSSDDKKPRLYGFKVQPKSVIVNPADKPEAYAARIKKRVKEKPLTGNQERSKAFVARMKSGHIGVFERMEGRKTSSGKEKLAELYAMSIPNMIKSREVAFEIQSKGQTYLQTQVQKEIRRVMGLK